MGYLGSPPWLMNQAKRREEFLGFINRKDYPVELAVGLYLLEDSEIGGTLYDKIERPDFSKKEELLNQVKKESVSEIEASKGSEKNKARVKAIFEKIKTDENFFNTVAREYEGFLKHLEKNEQQS